MHATTGPSSFEVWPGPAHAVPMGDATGDGLAEVLIVHLPTKEETDAATFAFRVLSPPWGTIWLTEVNADNVEWLADVDLDGDGLNDLLFVTLHFAGVQKQPTAPPPEGLPQLRQWEWRMTAYRGDSPTVLWERVETGAALVSDPALLAASDFFSPIVGGDADGDGGVDVWLNVLDRAQTPAGGAGLDRVEVLSGATGQAISRLALPTTGAVAAFPAGDLDGDALEDTLATTMLGETTYVGAIAATGAPLWVAPMPAPGLGFPIVDVTGDGRQDAVHVSDIDTFTFLAGIDGAALWSVEDPPFLGVLPGNIDGDAGSDIVFVDGDFAGGAVVARMLALAGDTGAQLYDAHPFSVPLPENGFASIELRLTAGDMDGDGVEEFLFNTERGPFGERWVADALSVRGGTGATMWTQPGTDNAAHAVGDVTGDGRADALLWTVPLDQSFWTASVVDGPSGQVRWTRTEVVDGVSGYALGNVGGTSAADVGLLVIASGDSRLEARDGTSGSVVFRSP